MAAEIDAEVGGESANSYVTLEEAQAYHDTHLYGSTWDDSDDDQRTRALIMATRLLDAQYEWDGEATSTDQALAWPRVDVPKPGIEDVYADDEIPEPLRNAVCEYARALLTSDRTADSDLETYSVRSLTAGPVSLTFGNASAKAVPDAVAQFAGLLGTRRGLGGSGAVTMGRG